MNFIANLASTLGIEEKTAEAVAGLALKKVQGAVAEKEGQEAARQLGDAVPEMGQWEKTASQLQGDDGGGLLGGLLGGGAGGDLLGSALTAFGGQDVAETAAIVAILSRFDIDASKAAMAAPVILNFLKSRLSPDTLKLVTQAAPFLTMLGGGKKDDKDDKDDAPDAMDAVKGMLGGLFD